MTTSAVLGSLTAFKLGDGGGTEIFTKVAEILRVGPVGTVAPEVDVTNMDSTTKEYIGGLPDGQQVEFDLNWVAGNTEQNALRDGVGSTKNVELLWPDASQAAFAFVILGFSRGESTTEGQLTASISGRITGAITWT